MFGRLFYALLVVATLFATPGLAQPHTYTTAAPTNILNRTAGEGLLAIFETTAPADITSMMAYTWIATPHKLKFVIYEPSSGTFLYVSPEKSFPADTGLTEKLAGFPPVSLSATKRYNIGVISDQAGGYGRVLGGLDVQGPFILISENANISNFTNPSPPTLGGGAFRVAVSLNLPAPAAAPATVPTLTEWAMILLGLGLAGGAALVLHRRRLSA